MDTRRIKQLIQYGWQHAGVISKETGRSQLNLFLDIVKCYRVYRMWSNQYLKEKFYTLSDLERATIGARYKERGEYRDQWHKEYKKNLQFFAKWGSPKYQQVKYHKQRNEAYKKQYGMGEGCHVEYSVEIGRHHYLPGTISIGKKCLFASYCHIDYSGELIIEDGVKLTSGVNIETHHRDLEAYEQGKDVNIQSKLVIRKNAYIGTHAIILDTCHYIGKNARIGAGAVVTKDIPDNAVAVGIPAKVVRYLTDQK